VYLLCRGKALISHPYDQDFISGNSMSDGHVVCQIGQASFL